MIEKIIIFGFLSGFIYALIALGFSLIYGVSGVVNLTHGAFIMIGAYIFGILFNVLMPNVPAELSFLVPILTLLATAVITGVIGSIYYRLTLHQVLGDEVAILIISLFGCVIFQQIVYLALGAVWASQYPPPDFWPGEIVLFDVRVEVDRVIAALISLFFYIGLWIFTAKTKVGNAVRALSQDLEAAMLMGVSAEKMYMLVAGIAAGLASIASVLKISSYSEPASALMWIEYIAISFSIVILGGLGSMKGTVLGGLIFGYAHTIVEFQFPQAGSLLPIVPFVIMIIILIVRPKGLFGKRIEME
ncbi:MAG: branched-chain amino acid ABC transporter permease [Candidatus Bathyarchaeia archaeon]